MTPNAAAGAMRKSPGRLLWGLAADVAIFVITVWWSGLCLVAILLTRRGWPADVFGRIWSRWILAVCGIRVDVEGLEHVDRSRSYVILSNHLSHFDIWATLAALPLKIRFVAKKELLRVPIFGQALALSDHIVIDRSNPEEAVACINARVANQIGAGFCIVFYAEGTRSSDGRVHEFKKGGVMLALRTGLPIIPMSVSGTRKFLPKRSVIIRPSGRVKIVLGRPIETTGVPFDQRDALNERVRDVVMQNYIEDY
jgi:1-acyl-sn-glycerol-3-phosphate acyltransferase